MAKNAENRHAVADSLSRKLEGLSFTLSQDELDELGGVLKASGAIKPGQRAFTLNTAAYENAGSCW